jgi:DNA-binding IclR family transcriptional regulator
MTSSNYMWLTGPVKSVEPEGVYNAPKLERIFRMIDLMFKGQYTITRLSEVLHVDRRTVYRYMILIESVGFKVEKQVTRYSLSRDAYPTFVNSILQSQCYDLPHTQSM